MSHIQCKMDECFTTLYSLIKFMLKVLDLLWLVEWVKYSICLTIQNTITTEARIDIHTLAEI